MLQKVGVFNDLSEGLINKLEKQLDSFGSVVRFRFDISNPNPDPEKKAGNILFPFSWTLDPVIFDIIDNDETRKEAGVQKRKKIGIVDGVDDKNKPDRFRRIRVNERERGVKTFDLKKISDRENVAYLLLHPKLGDGLFQDKEKRAIITLVDEKAVAVQEREQRTARKKAMDVAEEMTDKDIIDFADAMSGGNNIEWDSAQDPSILRNKVEALAENNPEYFNDKVQGKNIEYQSLIKQAMTKKIIAWNPAEWNFIWVGNSQVLATLQPTSDKNEIEGLADILQGGGAKMDETYKKIKSLVGK